MITFWKTVSKCTSHSLNLDERTRAQLNGANTRCLSRFTGKTSHEEASKTKRTFDMVTAVRKRRHQWLGHILRMQRTHDDKERLVKTAVRAQYHLNLPGNIPSGGSKKRAGTAMIYSGTATRKRVAVPAHFVAVPEY